MTRPRLEVQALSYQLKGRTILNAVSFQVFPGEILGVLGPNGAGKTTAFELLAGLLKPSSGQVLWEGEVWTALPFYARARRGLGYLPQEPSVLPELTVVQNLQLAIASERQWRSGRLDREAPSESDEARLSGALEQFGLTSHRQAMAQRLSGGERRRLELARAWLLNARLLLLDEPFTGLDPRAIDTLLALISQQTQAGVAVVLTDHRVRECLSMCDRALLLFEGRKALEGTPEALRQMPEAARLYLGAGGR